MPESTVESPKAKSADTDGEVALVGDGRVIKVMAKENSSVKMTVFLCSIVFDVFLVDVVQANENEGLCYDRTTKYQIEYTPPPLSH